MRTRSGFNAEQKIGAGLFLVALALSGAGAWGWGWNIIKLIHMDMHHPTTMLIVRAIGILVFPVGCVIGYVP